MFTRSCNPSNSSRLVLAAAALAIALPVTACGDTTEVAVPEPSEVNTGPEDGDWIRIDGVIQSTLPEQFLLDYGTGKVTVEMDDWDAAIEGLVLMPGDKVSVTGRVDKDLFGTRSIEASAVYLDKLNTTYFASAADEEEFGIAAIPRDSAEPGVDYTGWVTGRTNSGFLLGSGPTKIAVDTSSLGTSIARSGVNAGDRVYVWGELTLGEDGKSVLEADGLLKLVNGDDARKQSPNSENDNSTNETTEKSTRDTGAAAPSPADESKGT